MGAPNIQQQLYLKTALNESKDGMFDHPADAKGITEEYESITEGLTMKYKKMKKKLKRVAKKAVRTLGARQSAEDVMATGRTF